MAFWEQWINPNTLKNDLGVALERLQVALEQNAELAQSNNLLRDELGKANEAITVNRNAFEESEKAYERLKTGAANQMFELKQENERLLEQVQLSKQKQRHTFEDIHKQINVTAKIYDVKPIPVDKFMEKNDE